MFWTKTAAVLPPMFRLDAMANDSPSRHTAWMIPLLFNSINESPGGQRRPRSWHLRLLVLALETSVGPCNLKWRQQNPARRACTVVTNHPKCSGSGDVVEQLLHLASMDCDQVLAFMMRSRMGTRPFQFACVE